MNLDTKKNNIEIEDTYNNPMHAEPATLRNYSWCRYYAPLYHKNCSTPLTR